MSGSGTINQSIQYWTLALRTFETLTPTVQVKANQKIELNDDLFDLPSGVENRWFSLDPGHYDLFLDDTFGTLHLANLSGAVNYVRDDTRLVTWYGYEPSRYRILLNSQGVQSPAFPDQELVWFAWDTRAWTVYVHDGKLVIPVFNAAEIATALQLDPKAAIWMGWNGSRVDLFTVEPRNLPRDLRSVFVTRDLAVGQVHSITP